ncbi:unnamed protein product [Scytosiphon promiscuus]
MGTARVEMTSSSWLGRVSEVSNTGSYCNERCGIPTMTNAATRVRCTVVEVVVGVPLRTEARYISPPPYLSCICIYSGTAFLFSCPPRTTLSLDLLKHTFLSRTRRARGPSQRLEETGPLAAGEGIRPR